MKVGVIIPTFARPDLLRRAILQFVIQTRKPDLICIHQNGTGDKYSWAIEDLDNLIPTHWIYNPQQLKQHSWYSVPLRFLLENDCTHIFWADHDDIFLSDHIEKSLLELNKFDFRVSPHVSILYQGNTAFEYSTTQSFNVHAPGGMSSSMAFNRAFAIALLEDLESDQQNFYADNVVANITMPKFRCYTSDLRTTIYTSHYGSSTSASWAVTRLAHKEPDAVQRAGLLSPFLNPGGIVLTAHIGNIGDIKNSVFPAIQADGKMERFIQGFSIQTSTNSDVKDINFRARSQDGVWSDWKAPGDYAGTRGCSEALTGFSVRLGDYLKNTYSLCVAGLFEGSETPLVAEDSAECLMGGSIRLRGIQIQIQRL